MRADFAGLLFDKMKECGCFLERPHSVGIYKGRYKEGYL